ncbi:hypothetical protein J3R82DRAFT_9525 [Butyriboletus roseoflavus]|nr:hypothetical protein J3R82DRAFT_9525 [Butyriboletus roseoflavus]
MTQGNTKGLQAKPSTSKARHAAKKAAAATKKGRRHEPPKKTGLIKEASMRKALKAKVTKSIEQQMVSAASAGKLTIMKHAVPESYAHCPC